MSEEQAQEHNAHAGKKSPVAVVIVGILLVAVVGGGWLFVHQKSVDASHEAKADDKPKSIIHLESFIVNLADPDGKSFLRVGIDLGSGKEIKKGEGASPLEVVPSVRDVIIGTLTGCKAEDLLIPEGKKRLKDNLLKNLNDRVPELQVREVYFTDFLVQR